MHTSDKSKGSDKYKGVLSRVQKINDLLQGIIQSTLETHVFQEADGLEIPPNEDSLREVKCWDEMQCRKTGCPAYKNEDYRCWLIAGTFCGATPQRAFALKYKSCYFCKVFRRFTDTVIPALYENIGIMMHHFGDTVKQIREFAVRDNLTGLFNRNYLNIVEEREIQNAKRGGTPLSIILFDLNDFKMVNDTYGHIGGDEILKAFSSFLQEYARGADLLFRIGGDEFMLLMNGAVEEHRKNAEKRLLEGIGEWNEKRKGVTLPVPITFSLGGATAFSPMNFNELIAVADKRLYANKQLK